MKSCSTLSRRQLRRHQAGDVEHDLLIVDRRDPARDGRTSIDTVA
jgi:hypothetical protein